MSDQPVVDAICNYVDEMCGIVVYEATGFYTPSTVDTLKQKARETLRKQLKVLAERENQLAHSPADPHGHEPDTVDLHPNPVGVRTPPNVDAAD